VQDRCDETKESYEKPGRTKDATKFGVGTSASTRGAGPDATPLADISFEDLRPAEDRNLYATSWV